MTSPKLSISALMHSVPQLYGTRDYLYPEGPEEVEVCLEECIFKDNPCDKDVFDACVHFITEHNLYMSKYLYSNLNISISGSW